MLACCTENGLLIVAEEGSVELSLEQIAELLLGMNSICMLFVEQDGKLQPIQKVEVREDYVLIKVDVNDQPLTPPKLEGPRVRVGRIDG